MEEIINKIESCFNRLQTLDIKPTLNNMEKLTQTMYDLRDIYNELKEGAENERPTSDNE